MKRLTFLSVAFITFAAGVTLTRFSTLIVRHPRKVAAALQAQTNPDVQIRLRRIYQNENGVFNADFDVLNRSGEPLFYLGYNEDDHEQWAIRRGNRSHRYAPLCSTGIKERLLAPNESAKFMVFLGDEGGDVQVGFDFRFGESRSKQTIWTDQFHVTVP